MSSGLRRESNLPQTFLLVENPEDVRGLIGTRLSRKGFRVAEACCVQGAGFRQGE